MPIRPTRSITPSEDASGSLRMDANLSKGSDNGISLLTSGLAAPGLFAAQVRPALEGSFLQSPVNPSTNGWGLGGVAGPFTQLATSVVLIDDDGLDGATQEIQNPTSGTFGPIDIAGYYAISATLQLKSVAGGGNPPVGNAQIAARSITPTQGASAYRLIAGQTVSSPLQGTGAEPLPVQTYGKWPFVYWGHMACATVFPLGRGSFVEFGVRYAGPVNVTAPTPGADSCAASTPHVSAWIVLVRAFAP